MSTTEDLRVDSLTARQREWLTHLQAWREQGGSLKAYAGTHGLSLSALYSARQLLRQRGVWQRSSQEASRRITPKLVPVRLKPMPEVASMYRVLLPNGVVLEVPEHADLARCRAMLDCVAQLLR